MKPNRHFVSIISLILLALGGCASHNGLWQAYPGEPLPLDAVSLLRGKNGYRDEMKSNEMIRIIEVSGKAVPNQRGVAPGAEAVTLLPGKHIVRIMYVVSVNHWNFTTYRNLTLNLQENCNYQIVALISSGSETPKSFEELQTEFHVHGESINTRKRSNCANPELEPNQANT